MRIVCVCVSLKREAAGTEMENGTPNRPTPFLAWLGFLMRPRVVLLQYPAGLAGLRVETAPSARMTNGLQLLDCPITKQL